MAKRHYTFTGKRVWIVGSTTGIGSALAERLSAQSAALALSARTEDRLKAQAHALHTVATPVRAYPLDVTEQGACAEAAHRIRAELGGIDALIYCAGDWVSVEVPDMDLEAFERQTMVNYTGLVRAAASVLPEMAKQREGLIVGLSSATAYLPLPSTEAYGASKAAVNYFLRTLRLDSHRHGVRVMTVCPGFVRTPLTDRNEFRMPFMVSPEAAAETVIRGAERGRDEVHFPLRLTLPIKFFGWLPRPLSEWLVRKGFRR